MSDAELKNAWYNPWAPPIFPAPPPAPLPLPQPGYPWWLSSPIFPTGNDKAAQAPTPPATQPPPLSPGDPWGSAPQIFPPANDVTQAAPPQQTSPLDWQSLVPHMMNPFAPGPQPTTSAPGISNGPNRNSGSPSADRPFDPGANGPQPARMFNDIVRSASTGVPIVGGLLNKIDAATNAALAPVLNPLFDRKDQLAEPTFGERYAHALRDQQGADQRFSTEHPVVDTAAKLTGGIASMAPVMAASPWTFSVGATLPGMVGRSAIIGATLGGADAATRGQDIPRAASYGGIFGAALPATGRAIGALVSPARTTSAANAIADSANTAASAREAAGGATAKAADATAGAVDVARGGLPAAAPESRVTDDGLRTIEQHLSSLEQGDSKYKTALDLPANKAMIDRLRMGLREPEDLKFFEHETMEAELMKAGMEAREAHLETLRRQGITYQPGYEAAYYHPSVIEKHPDAFSLAVLRKVQK
jgi:hypothetical protein